MMEKPEKRFLMDVMIHQQAEREAQRVQANREELVERIARAMRDDGTAHPLLGLHLYRSSLPLEPVHSVLKPSLCVIAQGSRHSFYCYVGCTEEPNFQVPFSSTN